MFIHSFLFFFDIKFWWREQIVGTKTLHFCTKKLYLKCLKEWIMKIKPIFDRVVLLPKEAEKETQSGIILPTTSQEKSQIATVVAVGEGGIVDGKEVKMQVKVGQEVLYAKYSGTECSFDGKKYIVIKQSDILAVLEK